ncbi:MAG: site-specific integrase, partial [Actinomycetota bacterium]|nr:site-specific integrase [Actinomycetota bacterium]
IARSVSLAGDTMVESAPKSGRSRDVPVPAFVVALLAERLDGRADDELVFPSPGGRYLRLNNARRRWWARACAEADGVPDDLTFHELRHTCASLAIQSGANIKTLQRMLGHSSAALTLDRYGHLYDDDLALVAERLDNLRPQLRAV